MRERSNELVKRMWSHARSSKDAPFWTKVLRRWLVGGDFEFALKSFHAFPLDEGNRAGTALPDELGVYVHVPFCTRSCPYCPYNKVPWSRELAERYFEALGAEIEAYVPTLKGVRIGSVYFGGGSPATDARQVRDVARLLKDRLTPKGPLCIELNPLDCSEENLQLLAEAGFTVVSLGVQSFSDRLLDVIGRGYTGQQAARALEKAVEKFESVNVDLMFALHGQTLGDIRLDLETAINLGASQITVYPLFTFPYSSIGRARRLKKLRMPNVWTRRRQYYFIYDHLAEKSWKRTSVWSFLKDGGTRYSSVTREYYVGFGAGAGSLFPWGFYLNTFSVERYVEALSCGNLPTALELKFTKRMDDMFWLYWRLYDTYVPVKAFNERFYGDRNIKCLFGFLKITGMLTRKADAFWLTKRGAFWIHLLQNHFALNYVNRIWSVAMVEPFPERIEF